MPLSSASGSGRNSYAELDGAREFAKRLGVAAEYLPQATKIWAALAQDTIVLRAVLQARTQGRLEARAAADVRKRGMGTVVYGGKAYSMGAEFGAYQYKQFQRWRGRDDDAGYFFWPAVRQWRDEDMEGDWFKEVQAVLRLAFPQGIKG